MRTTLTAAERRDIYEHIQELVDIATQENQSIYGGLRGNYLSRMTDIREYLERSYSFRFVQLKEPNTYITNFSYDQQWTFALFVAEFVLSGDWR